MNGRLVVEYGQRPRLRIDGSTGGHAAMARLYRLAGDVEAHLAAWAGATRHGTVVVDASALAVAIDLGDGATLGAEVGARCVLYTVAANERLAKSAVLVWEGVASRRGLTTLEDDRGNEYDADTEIHYQIGQSVDGWHVRTVTEADYHTPGMPMALRAEDEADDTVYSAEAAARATAVALAAGAVIAARSA